jgi:hypothetical protein
MTVESLNRGNNICKRISSIDEAIKNMEEVQTGPTTSFRVCGAGGDAYFDSKTLDPVVKESCKAMILSNLESKKKQLESELGKL